MKTGTCQEPPMDRTARDTQTLSDYERQQKKLATKLLHTGFIWGGSIQSQWTTCGKPGCACSHAPQARHGPYVYWTSKKNGRTVARLLHSPEIEILTEWVANRREVDRILAEMKKLSQKAFEVVLRMRLRGRRE
jgi:hypothetical protein